MTPAPTIRIFFAALVISQSWCAFAQVAASNPGDSEKTCQEQLEKVSAAVTRMPPGVEKAAAQKEIDAAKLKMANGDMVGCNTHAQNAMQAVGTKSPP